MILGFITSGLAALIERVKANGGGVVQAAKDMPEHGVSVFSIPERVFNWHCFDEPALAPENHEKKRHTLSYRSAEAALAFPIRQ